MIILYEDPNLIVVDKPAGLLSQGESTGDENLVDLLRQRFGRPYVGLVHRLDRNTSGVMVIAKRTKAANRLTEALKKGELERTYLAWVHGKVPSPARWRHWLVKDEKTNVTRAFKQAQPGTKESALSATPLAQGHWNGLELTLLELKLETGRSHQIRAQASAEGHPLLGDTKYFSKALSADGARASREFGRPALHSHRLHFPHPIGGALQSFEAPLPADMASVKRA